MASAKTITRCTIQSIELTLTPKEAAYIYALTGGCQYKGNTFMQLYNTMDSVFGNNNNPPQILKQYSRLVDNFDDVLDSFLNGITEKGTESD